jgi:hypothetical protein
MSLPKCPTGTISQGSLLRWFRNGVLTSGLMDGSGSAHKLPGLDPYRAKQRLAENARELSQQAHPSHGLLDTAHAFMSNPG